jgi:hypothetical protein
MREAETEGADVGDVAVVADLDRVLFVVSLSPEIIIINDISIAPIAHTHTLLKD